MTDYLHNLAARNVAPAPAIQPRRLSRFEPERISLPVGIGQPLDSDEPTVDEALDLADSRLSTMSQQRPVATEKPSPESPSPMYPHRRSPDPLPAPGSDFVKPPVQSTELELPAATQQSDLLLQPPPLRSAPDRQERSAPDGPPQTEVQRASARTSSGELKPGKPLLLLLNTARESSAIPDHEAIASEYSPTLESLLERALAERVVSPVETRPPDNPGLKLRTDPINEESTVIKAAIDGLRPQASLAHHPEPPRQASAAASGPTIHVSIGRVEVRATRPRAPEHRKRATKPPVMGLDEYLRRRAEGDR